MNIHTVFHIPTLHGKIFEGIFPMWKFAKLLPSKQIKTNLTFKIYCPNFGGNYISLIYSCLYIVFIKIIIHICKCLDNRVILSFLISKS